MPHRVIMQLPADTPLEGYTSLAWGPLRSPCRNGISTTSKSRLAQGNRGQAAHGSRSPYSGCNLALQEDGHANNEAV